jgi:hypothetical protein
MKTWDIVVHIICHVNVHVNSHVNVHVSMPHQQSYHVHDLFYEECYVMFVMFICATETGSGLDWVGSNLIYDGVEMSQIASIYDDLCKNITELIRDA